MSEEQKANRENRRVPFDLTSCMAMMEEMMAGQGEGRDCTGMMSQMMGQDGCAEVMATCCGVQGETEETSTTEATPKT